MHPSEHQPTIGAAASGTQRAGSVGRRCCRGLCPAPDRRTGSGASQHTMTRWGKLRPPSASNLPTVPTPSSGRQGPKFWLAPERNQHPDNPESALSKDQLGVQQSNDGFPGFRSLTTSHQSRPRPAIQFCLIALFCYLLPYASSASPIILSCSSCCIIRIISCCSSSPSHFPDSFA